MPPASISRRLAITAAANDCATSAATSAPNLSTARDVSPRRKSAACAPDECAKILAHANLRDMMAILHYIGGNLLH
jgi:hypothetical protein